MKIKQYLPKFFYKEEGDLLTNYFLIEWKPVFSIGISRINNHISTGYHSYPFNSINWLIKGKIKKEEDIGILNKEIIRKKLKPSIIPNVFKRHTLMRLRTMKDSYIVFLRFRWKYLEYGDKLYLKLSKVNKYKSVKEENNG